MGKFILSFKRKGTIPPVTPDQPETPSVPDLDKLSFLPKPISKFTIDDIGTTVSIPYTDSSSKILLNNGCIEFEVVGVNHHKDTNNADTPTITLMTKNIIRYAAFDVVEPNSQTYDNDQGEYIRRYVGNNCWSVSNIRQWLNSSGAAGSWFNAQHRYDATPTLDNVSGEDGIYSDAPGFLAGFSADILQHFTDITNITAKSKLDGSGSEETVDKVFLPSYTEMYGSNNNGIAEGIYLSLRYTDDNSRKKTGANSWYWMRSPAINYQDYGTRIISSDGFNGTQPPGNGDGGIAPIIVLH